MLTVKNIRDLEGRVIDYSLPAAEERIIDGRGLTLLPALIDPHVHFRVPGAEYKEDWRTAAKASLAGGVTQVFDMPNNTPLCVTAQRMEEKKKLIDAQLREVGIPLRYQLYFGASNQHVGEIAKAKSLMVAIKIFMGSSTGELLIDDPKVLESIFREAATHDLIVAVHAEDEKRLLARKAQYAGITDPAIHSTIRDPKAAADAIKVAVELSAKYSVRLYVLHVSTLDELEVIREAKQSDLDVFAEATSLHLFLSDQDYPRWGTKVQLNPPIRSQDHVEALWEAVNDGTIDTIATDHAPHTLQEKSLPYPQSPSGIPGVETRLPLLLNAVNEKRLSLKTLVKLTRTNIETIFRLPSNDDSIIVDMNKVQEVRDEHLHSKCKWSPFTGRSLKGWPLYTILRQHFYEIDKL